MKNFLLCSFSLLLTFMLVGCGWNNNQEQETPKANYDYLVLVNKQHRLPEDWEANVQLVETQNAYGETIKVEKEAFEKYNELKADLAKEWIEIDLDSVYRSVEKQQQVWDEFEQEKWLEYAQTYVAVPWYSEHHTALALDIVIRKDGVLIYENEDMIAEPEIFAKIHEKLADYGFILRYLQWKEDITGYGYEPWHLRYVWDVNVAKEIMDKWITLEEYLGATPSKYPVAEQVCLDNGWEVTVDDEWAEICLLWGRWIYLAAMEEHPEDVSDGDNIDFVLPEWAKTSLTTEELDEIAETNFPKWYTYSSFNMDKNIAGDNWEYTYPEDLSHTLLIPEHATMASRRVLSSGVEDGMIKTDTEVTLQDGTLIDIVYVVDPVTLQFVAANTENGSISTNYQFIY